MALSLTSSKFIIRFSRLFSSSSHAHMPAGTWGSGAGKGGGSGGSVREAGGSFGKLEAAREEEYFRKLQSKQLAKLKQHIDSEISHHKKLIQQHKDAIARLEGRGKKIKCEAEKKSFE